MLNHTEILVQNLLTKKYIKCNMAINDTHKFINKLIKYQQSDIIYLYQFKNDSMITKYISINNNNEPVIEHVTDDLSFKILYHIYDINYDDKSKINSIINSIKIIAKNNNITEEINENKITESLNKLNNDIYKKKIIDARDKYLYKLTSDNYQPNIKVKQEGGILIWLAEKYLFPKLPNIVQTILWSILEIIDIILIIAISIPGLQFVEGLGIIIDIIAIIYSFLRYDIVGIVGSTIAFIPIIGNIIGGSIRSIAKGFEYYGKLKKSEREARQEVRYAKDVVHSSKGYVGEFRPVHEQKTYEFIEN